MPRQPPPAWWQIVLRHQEWRAEQSSHALEQLLHVRATVARDGDVRELDADKVVPGDVIWLESGNRVPADVRLLSTHGLEIDESLLTGESLAVLKDAAWHGDAATPVGDRRSMACAGSMVVRGRGKAVVVSTGAATSVGQLAIDVMGAVGGKPPLLLRMERFSRVVAVVVLVASVAVAAMGVVLHGHDVLQHVPLRRRARRLGDPRGAAGGVVGRARDRGVAHGAPRGDRASAGGGRGSRQLHPRGERQDGDAHLQRADGARDPPRRRGPSRGDGRGIRPRGGRPARRTPRRAG